MRQFYPSLLAIAIILALVTESQAGPIRNLVQRIFHPHQPAQQAPQRGTQATGTTPRPIQAAIVGCAGGSCPVQRR